MKGRKPDLRNVVPMKSDTVRAAPPAPDFLCDTGRAVWDELAPMLVQKDRLDPLFQYQFASYCASVASFIAATNDLALHGHWYETKTRNGIQQKKRASWGQQVEAMNHMRRDAALFGLSPVDDARLSGGGQGDLFADVLAQLKGQGGASA